MRKECKKKYFHIFYQVQWLYIWIEYDLLLSITIHIYTNILVFIQGLVDIFPLHRVSLPSGMEHVRHGKCKV